MKPFRAHYIDTIQLAENSYLCFPTAPEKLTLGLSSVSALIGQLIKFSPSFAHFNFLVFTVGGIFKLSL